MQPRPFRQVDVFSEQPFLGNPVAVVHAAEGLSDAQMQAFARWTNLSETTFLLAPDSDEADYRVRIFTPGRELPFAGHPTLGSCHAWLEAGGVPRTSGAIVQECAAGLIPVRRDSDTFAFAAPPLLRDGPLDSPLVDRLRAALKLSEDAIVAHQWVDNGPGWCALLLDSAESVRGLQPDFGALGSTCLGVIGPLDEHEPGDFEVRAFVPSMGVPEDPVTGSLNAGLAQWLMGADITGEDYIALQGSVLGRAGKVHLRRRGQTIWVGGCTRTAITGEVVFE